MIYLYSISKKHGDGDYTLSHDYNSDNFTIAELQEFCKQFEKEDNEGSDPKGNEYFLAGEEDENGLVFVNGNKVSMSAAAALMDDEIREEVHRMLAPCSNQDFCDAYCRMHLGKYGTPFIVN